MGRKRTLRVSRLAPERSKLPLVVPMRLPESRSGRDEQRLLPRRRQAAYPRHLNRRHGLALNDERRNGRLLQLEPARL